MPIENYYKYRPTIIKKENLSRIRAYLSVQEQKTPALDARVIGGVLENTKTLSDTYREDYRGKEVQEEGTPLVDIAEQLAIAQRYLGAHGLTLETSNELRTSAFQKLIKENHENFRGKDEVNRFFASEDASPHLSGGAVDVYLMKDGKRVDLRL